MFSVVAKKYLEENPRARRTQRQVQAEYERFIQVTGGDRPVGLITKVACRTYKEHLLQVRKVSLATVMKHLQILSSLFTWAERQGYMPEGASNPVKGLAPNKQESARGALVIRPFTDEELGRVFSSPNFIKQRVSWPERYWVSLMCLYQLCGREEAGQVALVDIGVKDGIACMSITDLGEDQSGKNSGSKRTIPIHSSLIALGFLEYVQDIRKAKHTRLFPQLTLEDQGYSDGIGKWFARHMDRVGLCQPELVMHSLRHGIHYLHALGCPQDVAEMLTGHTLTSVHDTTYAYRELTPLTRLRDGLERMQFPTVLEALQGVR
jgi:integrase